jgi:hypothetical protein
MRGGHSDDEKLDHGVAGDAAAAGAGTGWK